LKQKLNDLINKNDDLSDILEPFYENEKSKRIRDEVWNSLPFVLKAILDLTTPKSISIGQWVFILKDLIKLLNFFKQVRNIYAHGDGTITRIFMNKIKNYIPKNKMENYKLGNKFIIEDQFLRDVDYIFMEITAKFDKCFIKNYPDLIYKEDGV